MNTSSYSREPPSPKRATPKNASVGEKVSHPSANPQSGRETKLYHLPGPTVDELLQRLNGNSPPTKTIGRKAPGTNGFVLARDAVPWKSSAQREAERVETMRQQAEEEKGKVKSLSSQLPSSFATSSQDVDKENAEGRRDVCDGKKCENVAKNALGAPLKTRVNESVGVSKDWKNDDDVEADSVRASLTPPKGGEKKKSGDDKSSGKRCVDVRVVSAALSARDGKKARIGVVGERTHEKQKLRSSEQILLQRTRTLEKQMHTLSSRLNAFEQFFEDTINSRFEETNGFIFEVLTLMASTSSLSRRADEQKKQIEQIEQKKQIEQIEQKEKNKEKNSLGV
jgi:hypothetical protein